AAALPHGPAGARVLDVGCGLTDLPGRLLSYVGCDRDPDVLRLQRSRFPFSNFFEWDFERGVAPSPLAEKGPFDVVLLLAVLEHVAEPRTCSRSVGKRSSRPLILTDDLRWRPGPLSVSCPPTLTKSTKTFFRGRISNRPGGLRASVSSRTGDSSSA